MLQRLQARLTTHDHLAVKDFYFHQIMQVRYNRYNALKRLPIPELPVCGLGSAAAGTPEQR